jgi:hypothetical protein
MKKLSALNRFEQLDQQLENQLKILATQDDQLLFKSPGPGEWSPIPVGAGITELSEEKDLQRPPGNPARHLAYLGPLSSIQGFSGTADKGKGP